MKKRIKYFVYNLLGSFNYFNNRVFFPRNSLVFNICVDQGIYEKRILDIIGEFYSGGHVFDVGTNIGLISTALLHRHSEVTVHSFEPSTDVLMYLEKTHSSSPYKNRWKLIKKAVGKTNEYLNFLQDVNGDTAFNKATLLNSGGIKVEQTTLDKYWTEIGKPKIDAIKIDIEGFDFFALQGAIDCIESNKPLVIIEWTPSLIYANNVTDNDLWNFIKKANYDIYTLNTFFKINSLNEFKLAKLIDINFILLPSKQNE